MITLNYDIIMLCNLNCPYCFQRRSKMWKTISPISDHNLIIDQLAELTKDIHFTIIGGEPLLHPHLKKFVSDLQQTDCVKEIEIYTNGKKFLDLPNTDKIQFTLSSHNGLINIENVKKYSTIYGKENVDLILMMDNLKGNKYLANILKDFCNLSFNSVIDFDTMKIKTHEVFDGIRHDEPHFKKGCTCKVENFDINVRGDILLSCLNKGHNIHKNSLKEIIDQYLGSSVICGEEICMGS